MKRILSVDEAIKLSKKLQNKGETIILAGGCFDVLHLGHIKFLEAAKKLKGILFVFIESDQAVKKIKGKNRPINNQEERAKVLSSIRSVDYVIKIPFLKTNDEYDKLVMKLKPSIIATTKASMQVKHNLRQAKLIGAKVLEVIGTIPDKSTSKIAKIISDENQL